MNEKRYTAEDVDIKIGAESLEARNPRVDPEHRLAANAILGVLPIDIKRKIQAITMQHGMNRHARRATKVLIRRGIEQANRERKRDKKRKEDREDRDLALFEQIEKRIVRGLDWPLPGMTMERYASIKSSYYRVDTVKLDGVELPGAAARPVKIESK